MSPPLSTAPHVVVTPPPTIKLFLLLLHNCRFATVVTVVNRNANIGYAGYLISEPREGVI